MGIMDMFRTAAGGTQQPQATQQQPAVPGNIPQPGPGTVTTAATPGTANNGVVPTGTPEPKAPVSPLDPFKDLWEPVKTPAPGATGQPFFELDFAKMSEAAKTQDFSSAINKENLAAIAKGGEGAMEAMVSMLNSVAQDTYARSAYAATQIVERGLAKVEQRTDARIPGLIKQHNVSDNLRTENPAFSHPAAQPLITALESQFTTKFPTATAMEIKKMATDYMQGFASILIDPNKAALETSKAGKQGQDWSSFLTE